MIPPNVDDSLSAQGQTEFVAIFTPNGRILQIIFFSHGQNPAEAKADRLP